MNSMGSEKNHLMFMDDLKLYAKSEQGLESLVHTVRVFSEDIGMDFGIKKCAKLLLRRGKVLDEGTSYKYLRSISDG